MNQLIYHKGPYRTDMRNSQLDFYQDDAPRKRKYHCYIVCSQLGPSHPDKNLLKYIIFLNLESFKVLNSQINFLRTTVKMQLSFQTFIVKAGQAFPSLKD